MLRRRVYPAPPSVCRPVRCRRALTGCFVRFAIAGDLPLMNLNDAKSGPTDPHTLLENPRWLARLARGLAFDDAGAMAQETWLTGLRVRPQDARPPRDEWPQSCDA